jgi:chromosomal replication initiation ATPase DnaA
MRRVNKNKPPLSLIQAVVCKGEDVTPTQLRAKTRITEVRQARQMIMYFALEYGYTQPKSAAYVNLDHATALHARKVVNNECDTDKAYLDKIVKYRKKIDDAMKLACNKHRLTLSHYAIDRDKLVRHYIPKL